MDRRTGGCSAVRAGASFVWTASVNFRCRPLALKSNYEDDMPVVQLHSSEDVV